ncbi:MAG TPA: hypothetical protein DEP61_10140 [Lachnospiraceae bacterium]|nr:hypothetical protein [Lachnospiraceae bacterium]
MAEKVKFQYFQGEEAEQYTFYRIPKQLFTVDYFKSLSSDAKILYGLMLDRMSLSIKNNWFDDQNRAYIYFSIEDIVEYLGCGKNKAVKLMKELDIGTGIGLIEKRRQGFGKANIIYVKKFMVEMPAENSREQSLKEASKPTGSCQKQTSVKEGIEIDDKAETEYREAVSGNPEENTENVKENRLYFRAKDWQEGNFDEITSFESPQQKFENQTTGEIAAYTESRKVNFKNPQNQHSRIPKNNIHEVYFGESNNTYKSNNKYNNKSYHILSRDRNALYQEDRNGEIRYDMDIIDQRTNGTSERITDTQDKRSVIQAYQELIKRNIEYDSLINMPEVDHELVQEIYELILETVLCLGDEIVIASNRYPAEIVRSRFLKLKYMHIRYVMECLEKNTTKVKNIRKYLLATLFNAPATMDGYYWAEVNHDWFGKNNPCNITLCEDS